MEDTGEAQVSQEQALFLNGITAVVFVQRLSVFVCVPVFGNIAYD